MTLQQSPAIALEFLIEERVLSPRYPLPSSKDHLNIYWNQLRKILRALNFIIFNYSMLLMLAIIKIVEWDREKRLKFQFPEAFSVRIDRK